MQVCGQGAWHAKKHGATYRKRWKKPHSGVDGQGCIIASTVTDGHAQDPAHVPALLVQVDQPIDRFIGDGISEVLSSRLKALFKGSVLLPVDSCNKAALSHY